MNKKQTRKLIKVTLGIALGYTVMSFFINEANLLANQQQKIMNEVIKKSNIDPFLKAPTNYSFSCTPTSKGKVLYAKLLQDGTLIIHYESFWEGDGDHSGVLTGKYNASKNRFDGFYKTNDNRFYGEQNLIFEKNGEAQGTWDNGYGTTHIRLKK
ncbi:hypothetical protein IWQ47_001926 [Aquimarina sp. EL_43]|uniref:hypothetical protein n=1 Tax=Aquimarina TaxID=290174 RepID=UPI000471E289|nr:MULTISPECIES: hypothetical protein [Aquimarina]MBG6129991.1 hypothetical protein [Aquimarina sp. EL_35]MBG6148771.1 hypothetical protein [Aquimarina sp. EL_32]MBG6168855.1 hypothetical protein [Aquimarina sp. EL_43]